MLYVRTREQGHRLPRAEEVWSKGNFGLIEELVAPEYVARDPPNPEEVRGPEGLRRYIKPSAPPSLHATYRGRSGGRGREEVLTRWTARGTYRGGFFDLAPSGKRLEIAGMSMDRFSGGRFVESWENYDALPRSPSTIYTTVETSSWS